MRAIKNDLFYLLVDLDCNSKAATISSILLSKGPLCFSDILRQIKIQKKFLTGKNEIYKKLSNPASLRILLIHSIKIGIIKFQVIEDQTVLYEVDENYLILQLYLPLYLSNLCSDEYKKVINLGIREGCFNFTQIKDELQINNNETQTLSLVKHLLNQQTIQHKDSNYISRPLIKQDVQIDLEVKITENDKQKKSKKKQKQDEKIAQIQNKQLKQKNDIQQDFSTNILSLVFNQKTQEEYWFKLNYKQILEQVKDMALFNHLSLIQGVDLVNFFKDLSEYQDELFDISLKKITSKKYYSQDILRKALSLLKISYSEDGEIEIPSQWQKRLRKNIKTTFIHQLIAGKYGMKYARVLECLRQIKAGDDKIISDKALIDVRETRKILMELNKQQLVSYDEVKMESNIITHTFGYDHYKLDKAVSDICTKTLTNLLVQLQKENIDLNRYKKKNLGGLCTPEEQFIIEALQEKVQKIDNAISNHLDQYIWFLE